MLGSECASQKSEAPDPPRGSAVGRPCMGVGGWEDQWGGAQESEVFMGPRSWVRLPSPGPPCVHVCAHVHVHVRMCVCVRACV